MGKKLLVKGKNFGKVNCRDEFCTDDLYTIYDFVEGKHGNEILISSEQIDSVLAKNFYGLAPEKVELILSVAQKATLKDNYFNFCIQEDGFLDIGDRSKMAAIKQFLREIKEAWDKFQARKHFNIVEFFVEE